MSYRHITVVVCDTCWNEEKFGGNVSRANLTARASGWERRSSRHRVEHLCPKCVEAERSAMDQEGKEAADG